MVAEEIHASLGSVGNENLPFPIWGTRLAGDRVNYWNTFWAQLHWIDALPNWWQVSGQLLSSPDFPLWF